MIHAPAVTLKEGHGNEPLCGVPEGLVNQHIKNIDCPKCLMLIAKKAFGKSKKLDLVRCADCKHPFESYMVLDKVWWSVCADARFLCVRCLQKRLKRPLTIDDFPDVPINELVHFAVSECFAHPRIGALETATYHAYRELMREEGRQMERTYQPAHPIIGTVKSILRPVMKKFPAIGE